MGAWSVPEVGQWLESLHFPPATVEAFRENAVAGGDLLQLTDADLESHLGLTPLLVSWRMLSSRAAAGLGARRLRGMAVSGGLQGVFWGLWACRSMTASLVHMCVCKY